jgi:hypothetical protein
MGVEIDPALEQNIGGLDAGSRLPPLELGRAQHVQPVLLTVLAVAEQIGPLSKPRIHGVPVECLDGFQQGGFRDHAPPPHKHAQTPWPFKREKPEARIRTVEGLRAGIRTLFESSGKSLQTYYLLSFFDALSFTRSLYHSS